MVKYNRPAKVVRRAPRRAIARKYKSKPSLSIQKYVKSQIHQNIENKFASVTVVPTNIGAYIGDNTHAGNIFPIMPSIGRGSQPNNRNGCKVNPRSLIIKGYLTLDLNDQTQDYDRVVVRLIAGFPKRFPRSIDALNQITDHPGSNWTNRLINIGGTDTAFTGTLQTLQSPVNRQEFTVKGQKFLTLSRDRFYDAPLVGSDAFRGSRYSTRFFTMKINCPKTLLYEPEANQGIPSNFAPVLCAGYALLNGSTPAFPDGTQPKPVTISYTTRFVYEDA